MKSSLTLEHPRLPVLLENIPILYEDEELEDMGETNLHFLSDDILHNGIAAFLKETRPTLKVYSNLNLYYKEGPAHKRTGSKPYVSPDLMVVQPDHPLPDNLVSYTIGEEGPAPLLTGEILSKKTAQEGDLRKKPEVYALLGIPEYILADPTGTMLAEKLLLKRLQPDRTWKDEQDADGGVTSQLDFRVLLEEDGHLRVVNAATGWRYPRPDEADAEAKARLVAEEKAQEEAVARQVAETARRQAELARRQSEERARAEAEARRNAEEQSRADAEARRNAEERLRQVEADLARLREKTSDQETK